MGVGRKRLRSKYNIYLDHFIYVSFFGGEKVSHRRANKGFELT